jgi:lipopolysaccharide transport system ATP-binding protein
METAIKIDNLSKKYKIYKKDYHRLFELISRKKLHKEYWALHDINLEIKKGEAIGIIGANGAGKSTLLKIICGALYKTTGEISIHGRILSLLELGTGFHPELTGIDNIFNSASMQGFSHHEINAKLSDIIEFADIGEHIYSPVKTYSSGMYVRLAFALYACLDPDIYIVDEALSVGDVFFQQKCYERMRQMKEQGVTIIMVSHDPAPIVNFCNRAILIDKGNILSQGKPSDILEMYQALEYSKGMKLDAKVLEIQNIEFGNESVELVNCKITNVKDEQKDKFFVGDTCKIHITYTSKDIEDNVSVGIQIKNKIGTIVFGSNTNWINKNLCFLDGVMHIYFELPLNLGEGDYSISVAAVENKRNPQTVYSWKEKVAKFQIISEGLANFGGEVYLPIQVEQIKE